jgi:GTP 3',8-cyclase
MAGGVKRSAAVVTMPKRYRQHQGCSHSVAAMANATDQLNRPLGVLRLSLTARCNLACPYCLPDGVEPPGLLTLAQRLQLIEAAVALGAHSLRLTGGEPLLHPELERLIEAVQPLRAEGLREIALTSNGTLLSAGRARALREAGLDRITLSLDGADGSSVARMAALSDARAGARMLAAVLAAIGHARDAGFDPGVGALKLNAVIQRGRNDDQLLPLAELCREQGLELRLIEYMDVGNRNGWSPADVVSASEMAERIGCRWPLEEIGRDLHSTARRWRYRDGAGGIAVVASVSQPFCGDCNRLRVTADGVAYTCLFAAPSSGLDLKPWLQPSCDPTGLEQALSQLWRSRHDRYSEERQASAAGREHAEMAYLGG